MGKNIYKYKSSGLVGLNYLIKYLRERNPKYLDVIRNNSKYIKLWLLIILMQNNHELIFDEVDNDTLDDLFNMRPIKRNTSELLFDNGSYYEYGIGIKTNSSLDYKLQFKIIRNSIAHNQFTYDGEVIHIKNDRYDYEAICDYKWLESAIVCTLSNRNYQFKNGLYDIFLISINTNGEASKEHLIKTLEDKTTGMVKVSLVTNSLERACKSLGIKYDEKLKFYSIYIYIKDLFIKTLNKYLPNRAGIISSEEFYYAVNNAIKELNTKLNGSFELEYIAFTKDLAEGFIEDENFNRLSKYKEQIDVLFNHYKKSYFPELENTLAFKYLMDIIDINLSGNTLSPKYELYLNDSYNFLVKALGNLVFNSIISDVNGYRTLSASIFKKYQKRFTYDFGHAKTYYKDYLKKLANSLEDAKKNGFPFEKTKELSKIKERFISLTQKIDSINKGENPEVFFNQMRNIFAHGYCEATLKSLRLYDKDINRYYYKYSKSKNSWEEKVIDNNPVIFNIDIPYDVFIDIINDICKSLNLSLEEKEKEKIVG